jgi:exopolyphosphatase/guanosine-5'-triphosphate,3'-diphosphate pyrophosphatase
VKSFPTGGRTPSSIPPVRVAVVDLGSNSSRLLIADVDGEQGGVEELVRSSQVTRLGDGVDASGALAQEAIDRVFAVLDTYRHQIE